MSKNNDEFNGKRIVSNLIFSIIAFALNMGISFFVTPFITANLGSDAYGFVKLANDFTNYASILSIALNSMASRYIMLSRVQGDIEKAKKYYSSVTIANMILSAFLFSIAFIIVIKIDSILDVPKLLLVDVKITFALTFLNFLMNLAFSTLGNCYYLTNRLDLNSVRSMYSNVIRTVCIIVLYYFFSPRIIYLAIGSVIATVYVTVANYYYHRKLTPDLVFSKKYVSLTELREVLSSGIWNSITKLSQIFSSGLDLLVTNTMIGSVEMGYLSVAKTVPGVISTFNATIASVFSPNMMMYYAKKDMDGLKRISKTAIRMMTLFVTIPVAILITSGLSFYKLWVPEQPVNIIHILSILTVINSCITGPLQPLYQIFTITNKIKQSSIVIVIYGFISIVVTIFAIKLTNIGVYAVAGVSLIGSVIVALAYHLPFAGIYIGFPWYTFFPEIIKSLIILSIECAIGFIVNNFICLEASWWLWILGASIISLFGLSISFIFLLNKEEKRIILNKLLDKIHKG